MTLTNITTTPQNQIKMSDGPYGRHGFNANAGGYGGGDSYGSAPPGGGGYAAPSYGGQSYGASYSAPSPQDGPAYGSQYGAYGSGAGNDYMVSECIPTIFIDRHFPPICVLLALQFYGD